MNLKEISLDEMELHSSLLDEAISCLLHTTLFVRSPGSVRPADVHCKKLAPLTYAKCGNDVVESSVTDAITQLRKSLVQVGPGLSRGIVTLSFYEKRENKGFFGMLSSHEKVFFERWKFPVLVNENALDSKNSGERNREYRLQVYESAREQVKARMLAIFDNANSSVDHVPASAYDFEIVCWVES